MIGLVVTGYSDDIIVIEGEIHENFYVLLNEQDGFLSFSDGTLLQVEYDLDGIWRFSVLYRGNLFNRKASGNSDNKTDEVYFKSGIKWVTYSPYPDGKFLGRSS